MSYLQMKESLVIGNKNILIKRSNFMIEKKDSKLIIHFNSCCETFLKSMVHSNLLNGSSISTSFKILSFYGTTLKTLDSFLEERKELTGRKSLSHDTIIRLLWCLFTFQKTLEIYGFSFYSISIEDIFVIDDWNFICINPDWIRPIKIINNSSSSNSNNSNSNSNNKYISFYSSFQKNHFCSPEILRIDSIPSFVDLKTFYFTLGSLAFYCLFDKYIKGETDFERKEMITKELESILGLKLYWFLKRCLEMNIENRHLLWI
jgi:hypothetical protein